MMYTCTDTVVTRSYIFNNIFSLFYHLHNLSCFSQGTYVRGRRSRDERQGCADRAVAPSRWRCGQSCSLSRAREGFRTPTARHVPLPFSPRFPAARRGPCAGASERASRRAAGRPHPCFFHISGSTTGDVDSAVRRTCCDIDLF